MTRSSISNSRELSGPESVIAFVKRADWIVSLVVALILSLGVLWSYDAWLRSKGVEQSFDNTDRRWSLVRAAVDRDDSKDSIVLLGASRMQGNMSLETLEQHLPSSEVYQLSVAGRAPYASLEDLAHNTDFRGTVMVSVMPTWIVEGIGRDEQKSLVEFYHQHWNWARALDTRLDNFVSSKFVFTDDRYSFRKTFQNLIDNGGIFTGIDYINTTLERERRSNFDYVDLAALQRRVLNSFMEEYEDIGGIESSVWTDAVNDLSALVGTIEARGGQVIFIRMPSGGTLRDAEEQVFPRTKYWDSMAVGVSGAKFIHFDDYNQLSTFETPDFSHLDRRDTGSFTVALLDVLALEGVGLAGR